MKGLLLYDQSIGRYIVQEQAGGCIPDDSRTESLHCGDCLKIAVTKNIYVDTRVEKDLEDDVFGWYFVGVGRAAPLIGHSVVI